VGASNSRRRSRPPATTAATLVLLPYSIPFLLKLTAVLILLKVAPYQTAASRRRLEVFDEPPFL
jgi:hypothetical protein